MLLVCYGDFHLDPGTDVARSKNVGGSNDQVGTSHTVLPAAPMFGLQNIILTTG